MKFVAAKPEVTVCVALIVPAPVRSVPSVMLESDGALFEMKTLWA